MLQVQQSYGIAFEQVLLAVQIKGHIYNRIWCLAQISTKFVIQPHTVRNSVREVSAVSKHCQILAAV